MGAVPVQDKWAWVSGLIAVGLGLAAHMLAGGSSPAFPVLLGLAALCCLAAQLLARWVHGPLILLLISGVAQQLLHFGFAAFGGYFPGNGWFEHLHGAGQALGDATAVAASIGGSPHIMLYTHMAAAILTLVAAAGVARVARRAASSRRATMSRRASPAATKSNTA
ncbi:hypothetical protein [Paenarthrobacter sp. JL.01a]|uniref:hypothetical protein n=1 Tax=Paenarthrobacter sp. JL.01a TaxID=2979324 RepID=UPI0021CA8974|nr:hypothetical protein [Paenarthrobacter sp. JL.01a]UXM92112.1 hypothetical protein N5P29_01955 [Paenarthrobacter sp. JL.01a]